MYDQCDLSPPDNISEDSIIQFAECYQLQKTLKHLSGGSSVGDLPVELPKVLKIDKYCVPRFETGSGQPDYLGHRFEFDFIRSYMLIVVTLDSLTLSGAVILTWFQSCCTRYSMLCVKSAIMFPALVSSHKKTSQQEASNHSTCKIQFSTHQLWKPVSG